jgi:hypothetical protein
VVDPITWYDILGVTPGASAETVRFAYQAKRKQLQSYRIAGAPPEVVQAATRGQNAIDAAWLNLGGRARREQYDEQIGVRVQGTGLAKPEPTASRPSSGLLDSAAETLVAAADAFDLGDVLEGMAVLAGLLAAIPTPGHRADRKPVTVPDVCGLFFRACADAVTMAGFRIRTVRLTQDPAPVEGLVVRQSPAPGQTVPRFSTLTIHVWHPARPPSRAQIL